MYKTSSGSDITLTIPYEYNGEALTLTNFRYSVLDATGLVLVGPVDDPTFDAANTESTITIDGTYNTTTQMYDVRTLLCELITEAGTYKISEFYEIEGDVLKLTPMVDSFMYFPESVIVRKKISEAMDHFDALENEQKAIALRNAFERLVELKYSTDGMTTKLDLSTYTAEQFSGLDAKFVEALKKAQIAEANHIVEVNPVRDKLKMGIISETIGESSMFFKQSGLETKSYYPGISDEAYPYLAKYLYKDTSNAQIWKLRRS